MFTVNRIDVRVLCGLLKYVYMKQHLRELIEIKTKDMVHFKKCLTVDQTLSISQI